MIADLLGDHEVVICQSREDLVACDEQYGDLGTSDFLTGLMQKHEKMAWMQRAWVEDQPRSAGDRSAVSRGRRAAIVSTASATDVVEVSTVRSAC